MHTLNNNNPEGSIFKLIPNITFLLLLMYSLFKITPFLFWLHSTFQVHPDFFNDLGKD